MDYVTLAKLSVLALGVIIFIVLIGRDTWKALKKGAHWIPGDALVLSALTIQAMNLLKGQSEVLRQAASRAAAEAASRRGVYLMSGIEGFVHENWRNLVMIHISRVMLCVLVAYFLPGMARPFSKESWGKLAALGLSILLHVLSETFNVQSSSDSWVVFVMPTFTGSGVIISISLIWLILLLSCATIANKSIQDIINQKIRIILVQQSNGVLDGSWHAVEHQVLKSWIVARACYPESIIARSVLSSSAAVAVTICIVISPLGLFLEGVGNFPNDKPEDLFEFITSMLEVAFIVIGWAIICWRWVSSVAYYGRRGTDDEEESWSNYFQVEDFWTRHILELQELESSQMDKTIRKMEIKLISTEEITTYLPPILLRWLYWLQFFVVIFSKGCWYLSELMFRNRVMLRLSSFLLDNGLHTAISEHEKVLQNVHFLWETPRSVIVTNRKAIIKAEKLLTDGNKDGQSCDTLLNFLRRKSPGCVGKQCLDPRTAASLGQAGEIGLTYLCKQDPGPKLAVEEHFMYASKRPWKLTAISLVTIIIRLFPNSGRDCLQAYSEARQVMGVVDEYDEGADSLLSKAADRVFNTLQSSNVSPSRRSTATPITMQEAVAAIAEVAQENKEKAEVIRDGKDSLDWKKAAAGNAVYKLCNSIDCRDSGDLSALEDELQNALADVIGGCIEKVGVALVENCSKWAQDMDERKLVQALYLAGKSRGLMEKLGWFPNVQLHRPATTEESTMV